MSPTSGLILTARLARWIPAVGWLASYRLTWLRADLVAGVTLAAYLIPAGLGDASLANLPPEAGLYACMFGGLFFWLFCSSRHTIITVTSAISLLIGSTLGTISGGDPSRFTALAAGTAILVGLIAVIAWLIKAGSIINFISESVMIGFKCGVALFLASTQLPKMFGVPAAHGDFWENSGTFLQQLNQTNLAALMIGGTALVMLVLGKLYLKQLPISLLIVVAAIVASRLFGLDERGVKLLGEVPQGLPDLGLPALRWEDLNSMLPLALACFLLAAVETAAVGRTFAAKYDRRLDANQEFLALGVSNLAAGFGQGFPVSGGMSQSVVNEGAGARTPLSGAIATALLLVVVLFFSRLLSALPQPVLAAVVLVAVMGLVNLAALRHLWRSDGREFVIAMVAMFGVLGQGLLRGVAIGAIISLVLLIRRAALPPIAVLGRIPGTRRFSDRERHPENETIPGMLVLRPGASLLYFNMNYVRDTIEERVRGEPETRLVVLDLSEVSIVDMHAAEMLAGLAEELAAKGVRIQEVEAHSQVRDRLRSEGLEERYGGIERLRTVADVADDFLRRGLGQEGVHVVPGDPGAVSDPFRTGKFAMGAHQSHDRLGRQWWKRRAGTGKHERSRRAARKSSGPGGGRG
jgi:sulfate permease, SulP family